jgi:hypothetical protein
VVGVASLPHLLKLLFSWQIELLTWKS